ncbi:hypothetical protein CEXT_233271 [Caerostris extrusa]|uniref:Uncharacterized protein n=1 Tax=Caerostris extrusa TaxID=172846 RepID=A0AAV4XWT1_CAEEX|nr:hypothetical protein CEXT_233271 [Caerostris extrusa]
MGSSQIRNDSIIDDEVRAEKTKERPLSLQSSVVAFELLPPRIFNHAAHNVKNSTGHGHQNSSHSEYRLKMGLIMKMFVWGNEDPIFF